MPEERYHPHIDRDHDGQPLSEAETNMLLTHELSELLMGRLAGILPGDKPGEKVQIELYPDITIVFWRRADEPIICELRYGDGPPFLQARTEAFAVDNVMAELVTTDKDVMITVSGQADYTEGLAIRFNYELHSPPQFTAITKTGQYHKLQMSAVPEDGLPIYSIF